MSAGIRITGISADYGPAHPVLRDLSLTIAPGELLSVLGPSGSGKTTLIRVLAGLHPASGGRIDVDGSDVTHAPPERRRVGLVPQDGALFPHLSAAANIAYGLRGVRARHAAAHPRVRELLELVDLADLGDRLPHELSGGQQQRIALARALAPDPRLVLLDEPFNALDAGLRQQVREDVAGVLRAAGVSGVLVTHDQEEALSLSDRVAVMRAGVLVHVGTPQEVYHRPADAWTARFVGDALLLPGVRTPQGFRMQLADPSPPSDHQPDGADRCQVLVRPEQVCLVPAAESDLTAVVTRVRFLGFNSLVDVIVDAGSSPRRTLQARVVGTSSVSVGDSVGIAVRGPLHAVPLPASDG